MLNHVSICEMQEMIYVACVSHRTGGIPEMKQTATRGAPNTTMIRLMLGIAMALGARGGEVAVLSGCSTPEDVVAMIRDADHVAVRYALGGNRETCYAVTAEVNGRTVAGYLLGGSHPDVAAFERDSRSHVPVAPPPAPPSAPVPAGAAKEEHARAEIDESFAGLSGPSPTGVRVSLDNLKAPLTVLYFWSTNDKESIREAAEVAGIFEVYGRKGVSIVGVVSGASAAQVRKVMGDQEVVWPQILDHGAIAQRYPQSRQMKYFILDRGWNVVAALKTTEDVHRALAKLRKRGVGA